MNFNLKQNLASGIWDDFIKANSQDGGFLQSSNWADFQLANGRKIWRLAVLDGDRLVAVALVIKHQLPFGQSYLYSPRGPVLARSESVEVLCLTLEFLAKEIKAIAQTERAIFWRLDPAWTSQSDLLTTGFISVGQVQPQQTLILDLTKSEAELLKNMKAKTRYNIKVGQRHQLIASLSSKKDEDFDKFWSLLEKTAARDRIKIHQRDYYARMLKIPGVELALAKSGKLDSNQPIAGNIMVFWDKWCIYLHGASDYQFRDQMAPYFLQWEMIKLAKEKQCCFYDFWGTNEKLWPGVTRFKKGFAPETALTEYVGAYDRPFNEIWYRFYRLSKILKLR